ncbi:TonB-dependent receptor [Pedobacter arcticus]|uniref:TonB-dependent receptor n=1 Tax=Pedobacter arcticus TaxID=752140 RepID=UPI0002D56B8F|nr:TonB-dependent receptor [Pedobacter arcticus]
MAKFFFFLLLLPVFLDAQTVHKISGKVSNTENEELAGVNLSVKETQVSTSSNNQGEFNFRLKAGVYQVLITYLGYQTQTIDLKVDKESNKILNIVLIKDLRSLKQVVISDKSVRNTGMIKVDAKLSSSNPNISQSFESILKQLPGVSTNNELSSQYSVRGGNFDENLIYINDVEIYKPYLVRNGQQEGLSLINPDLVSNVKFSAGGFTPRYGDKLSSVLDVQYKTTDSVKYTFGIGTNGVSATAFVKEGKFSGAIGYRNKQNKFILNAQPVVGAYQPQFHDLQGLLNYQISKKNSLNFFGAYNSSKFGLVPQSRSTEFGTLNEILRLNVDYEGQEQDQYTNVVAALTLNSTLSEKVNFKWINSMFLITEKENFDILGTYIFDEIENDFASGTFGQVKANRGIGAYQNYGRNELQADVYASELKLNYSTRKSFWETGLRFQYDKIADQLKEFELIDSAGFAIPNTYNNFVLSQSVDASNTVNTLRYTGYVQNTSDISSQLSFTGGLRFNYNNYTNEFIVSPRVVFAYKPKAHENSVYRFATGLYAQPPFYRETRNFDGSLNPNTKSQKSLHFVLSSDSKFEGLGTKLNFLAETYYKSLYNLTPYDIENLRIRYFADQEAKGYAMGADFRISGEFVKDLESSFRISIMQTAEDIKGDSYIKKNTDGSTQTIYPGYIKRPTDQRINFSAFFQDRLFNSPTYKVHLNLLYGSKLPTGPPATERYQQTYNIPAYKRLDIGFSKDILDPESLHKPALLARYFKSIIIYAEVFNLLNINNTVSYLWVTDVNNNQYAIPNYLTSRQLNVRLITKF